MQVIAKYIGLHTKTTRGAVAGKKHRLLIETTPQRETAIAAFRTFIAGILLTCVTFSLVGANIQWTGYLDTSPPYHTPYPDSGSFFNAGCWLNFHVPTNTDTATFGVNLPMSNGNTAHSPHTIHFGNFNRWDLFMGDLLFGGANAVVSNLQVVSDQWVFDFASGGNPGATIPPPFTGSLTVSNGFAQIIGSETAKSSVTVRNGLLKLNGPGGAVSSLVLSGGPIWLGRRTLAEMVVDGTNAAVTVTNIVSIDAGRLAVQNGATFLADDIFGYEAYFSVTGLDSLMQGFAALWRGELRIENGGAVSSMRGNGPAAATIGYCDSAGTCGNTATALVRGPGSRWTDIGLLQVGWASPASTSGKGRVQVEQGARMESFDSWLGNGPQFLGEVSVSGNGSIWTNSYSLVVGNYGPGRLLVEREGQVVTDTLTLGNSTNASGELFIDSGSSLTCRIGSIGLFVNSAGQVRVDGSASAWLVAGSVRLGNSNGPSPSGTSTVKAVNGGSIEIAGQLGIESSARLDVSSNLRVDCFSCGWEGGRLSVGHSASTNVSNGTVQIATDGILEMGVFRGPTLSCGLIKADSISLGGTLRVNMNGGTLIGGDLLKLLDARTISGSFTSLNLPILSSNLVWDTSLITVDGTILVTYADGRPVIRQSPSDTAVRLGGMTTLTAVSAGAPPFHFQWQIDGTNISGATNSALTITNASLTASGRYRVIISNAVGSAVSAPAVLTVGTSLQLEMYAGLTIAGEVGSLNRIEATADLVNTNTWITLTNIALPTSPYLWVDPQSAAMPRRFYRAVLVQ